MGKSLDSGKVRAGSLEPAGIFERSITGYVGLRIPPGDVGCSFREIKLLLSGSARVRSVLVGDEEAWLHGEGKSALPYVDRLSMSRP